MKLIVFGANGATGRLLVRRALAEGHAVTAVTRHPDAFPIEAPDLRVVYANALEPASVHQVMGGHDGVISSLGVTYKDTDPIYSQGARNLIAAMQRHGIRRLVCVTSIGVHTELAPDEKLIFRKVVGPILLAAGRSLYRDAREMEQIVRRTELDWTIVRPSGLFDAEAVSDYRIVVAPERIPGMFTARNDLAELLLREAVHDEHIRQCLEVITTEGTPNYLRVFLKEALRLGK